MTTHAIEARGLTRDYERRASFLSRRTTTHRAVDSIDFTVDQGELFGLLGPNGAGKTTTIKMLTTLLLPTGGNGFVLGHDVAKETARVRRLVAFVQGGDRGFYDRLSARDNLRYFSEMYELTHRDQRTRIPELLDTVGLLDVADQRVETFSRGMKQRLHIARGLLHRPRVLFLDEPTLGIDPVAGRSLRTHVRNVVASGTTIVLTTHYMHEADELCDRIAIVVKGRIRAQGTPAELKQHAEGLWVSEATLPLGSVVEEEAFTTHRHVTHARGVEAHGRLVLRVQGTGQGPHRDGELRTFLDGLLSRDGVRPELREMEPALEDAYVSIVEGAHGDG